MGLNLGWLKPCQQCRLMPSGWDGTWMRCDPDYHTNLHSAKSYTGKSMALLIMLVLLGMGVVLLF